MLLRSPGEPTIRQADIAVDQAAPRGRGRVEIDDVAMRGRVEHEATLDLKLRSLVRKTTSSSRTSNPGSRRPTSSTPYASCADRARGFLLARPMPIDDLERLVVAPDGRRRKERLSPASPG